MIKSILTGCLLLWAADSFAVSKVGGGTLSNPGVGFESLLPETLNKYTVFENDTVRGEGPPVFDGRHHGPQPQLLHVFMLPNEQPAWLSVDDPRFFRDYFVQKGWTEYTHGDSCVVAFKKENINSVTYVLNWGKGLGIIVNTNLVSINQLSAKKIVDTLTRTVACQWK